MEMKSNAMSTPATACRDPECCREWKQAMYLLSGLHPCLTVDDTDPMGQAQAIFDSVQAERRALAEDRDHARQLVEWLHGELRKRSNFPVPKVEAAKNQPQAKGD